MSGSFKNVIKVTIIALMVVFIGIFTIGCGGNNDSGNSQQLITVSHQPTYDGWATYEISKSGMDEENGFKINMMFFDSGMPQIEALPANQWDIGATGTVPALMAALRYDAYVIAVSDDESLVNTVMVRPDSPILNTKGYNPEYPDIYGTPEDIKGKKLFVTTVSGGHFVLSSYLAAFGLTDDDVNIMNLEQAQLISAFDSGEGDIAAVWAPFLYQGLEKGWKVVCSGDQVGAMNPMLLVVSKKFADENPELVVKFLDVYLQKANELKDNEENFVEAYKAYNRDWAAMEFEDNIAKMDLEKHVVYDLEEQLQLFDRSNGRSQIEEQLAGIINFFAEQGKFTTEEKNELLKFEFINDKFLKMLAKEKGIIE